MTTEAPELQDGDLAVVQAAVTLARNNQISSVEGLKTALAREGYNEREIEAAVGFWAHYEATKPGAGRRYQGH